MKNIRSIKIKITAFAVLCVLTATTAYAASQNLNNYQEKLTRVYTLQTTFDPERYAVFTASGNRVEAHGFFKDLVINNFYIGSAGLGSINNVQRSFTRASDGSFTASFSGRPTAQNAVIVLTFDGGVSMTYRIEYASDTGWFFGDNGLPARTSALFDNYHTASVLTAENYISAALDPREINETRDRLKEVVGTVTAGLTDEYQKARALNQWVADNIVYDLDARDTDVTEEVASIARTLRLNRSVCIGIANTYAALLEAAGLKVLNIKGGVAVATDGVPYELLAEKTLAHEWVAFWYEAENRWVYADPTWDSRGYFQNGQYRRGKSVIKHFDISPLALSFDHRGDRAELRYYFGQLPAESEPPVTTVTTTAITITTPTVTSAPSTVTTTPEQQSPTVTTTPTTATPAPTAPEPLIQTTSELNPDITAPEPITEALTETYNQDNQEQPPETRFETIPERENETTPERENETAIEIHDTHETPASEITPVTENGVQPVSQDESSPNSIALYLIIAGAVLLVAAVAVFLVFKLKK